MIQGFDPVVGPHSRVLVLGTIPGVASLNAGEYYAQARNSFWPIIEELFGIPRDETYDIRTCRLVEAGVALWDVLEAAERPGSLDSDIRAGSMSTNYFPSFLAAHPKIRTVFFNGAKAEEVFTQLVLPGLAGVGLQLSLERLPSTSPANTITFDAKLAAWSRLRDALAVT